MSTPRRTTYAVAIETRAKAIQEALGVYDYDACLERIAHIRSFADHLEREIRAERAANPHHVARHLAAASTSRAQQDVPTSEGDA